MGQVTRDAIALVMAELHNDTDAFVHVWERATRDNTDELVIILVALVATFADAIAKATDSEMVESLLLRCSESTKLP